jgi:TolA-binding protein
MSALRTFLWLALPFLVLVVSAPAADREHATPIRELVLAPQPGGSGQSVAQVERGRDLVILARSSAGNDMWLQVTALAQPGSRQQEATGWAPAKIAIATSTPSAEEIIYGAAVDSEIEAEKPKGRRRAAEDALRLYQRTAEFFPDSDAGHEALWRAADIQWQLDRARKQKPIDETTMQNVIRKLPGSRFADLAAYTLLENQLCGDWKGQAACPAQEAEIYERYAREHPHSPKAAEALYNAAWRTGVIADIYRARNNKDQSTASRNRALALAQELANQFPQAEWKYRAETLVYKLQKNIPLYGTTE